MSVYRTFKRTPLSDVHHVASHTAGPKNSPTQTVPIACGTDWAIRRKARPAETLLPMTARWMATLPFQPMALAKTFPRIANTLTALWSRPDMLSGYLSDLLVDKRGGRQGFPADVLEELHALRAYYTTLHPDDPLAWDPTVGR
jgi:hypothetical protein